MAIGSTSYSDIAAGLNRVVEEMQQRNTLTDVLILILSVSLMICSGLTHLMALEGFDDGLNWESQILMAIIGGVYIAEAFVLISNFFYFRVRIVIVLAVVISVVSLAVGVVRLAESSTAWKSYFILFPIISDIIIIPSLLYSAYSMDRNYVAAHSNYVQFNEQQSDNSDRDKHLKVMVSGYKRTDSETSDANSMINFNTRGMDLRESDANNHSFNSTAYSSKSNSVLVQRDEDDEKAEELVTNDGSGESQLSQRDSR